MPRELRPHTPWAEVVYDWQPYLRRGLIDTNVMVVGQRTVELIERVLDEEHEQLEIENVLLARAEYIDDQKWCEGVAKVLGLEHVALYNSGNEFVPIRIRLDGVAEPLTDARVVEAAVNAMRFRKLDAIGIEAGGMVAVLQPGKPPAARLGTGASARTVKSQVVITR